MLDTLGKTKDATLSLKGNNFLQDSLFAGLSYRMKKHKEKKSDSCKDDRKNARKKDAIRPHDDIYEEERTNRIFPKTVFRYIHPTEDKSRTRDSKDDSPSFYRNEHQSIGIHKRHKDSPDEVIPHRKDDHSPKSRYSRDDGYRSFEVDFFFGFYFEELMRLLRESQKQQMQE